jgi:hypothetical protein
MAWSSSDQLGSNARVGGPYPSPRPVTVPKPKSPMTEKIIYVTWADAHMGEQGWLTLEDYEDDGEAIVHTVGFLIPLGDAGSKEGHVTVWQSLSEGDGLHPFHIPVAMVRTMKVVDISV